MNKSELIALAMQKLDEQTTSIKELCEILKPIAKDVLELIYMYMGREQIRPKLEPHLIPTRGKIAALLAEADHDPDYNPDEIQPREQ